ncbi:hypothetical protein OROHE_024025 [Orobanche hederae]
MSTHLSRGCPINSNPAHHSIPDLGASVAVQQQVRQHLRHRIADRTEKLTIVDL